MAIRKIVKFGDSVLETSTSPIQEIDDEIRQLVSDLWETMYAAPGVGLAANQIGVSLRLAVIDLTVGEDTGEKIVLINPRIIETSGNKNEEEGCLSIPGFTEFVDRPEWATVRALDLDGKEFTMEGEGLLARAFCHETDHLDGKLYVHRLGGIKRSLITKRVRKAAQDGEWEDVYP